MAVDYDVGVIGGGIVGLAFAWEAARRGRRVAVFERDASPQGATVRNFGMVWPVGQPPGPDYQRALRSLRRWQELAAEAGVWVEQRGSLHLARHALEEQVLHEFLAHAPEVQCEWLDAGEAVRRFPMVRADGLRGGLYSPTEHAVEPRAVPEQLRAFLAARHGVAFFPGTTIVRADVPTLTAATGATWQVGRAFVCSGADFSTLFPAEYAASGLRRCKLQMLATAPQPDGAALGVHVAGGLTLAHYKSFEVCPSLGALKTWLKNEYAEYFRYGIHVMAAQNSAGEIVIGDSHEYDGDITPFDSGRIDRLILDYLGRLIDLPDPGIARRWSGIYAKHPTQGVTYLEPRPGCVIVSGFGGAGMTLAFGHAEEWWAAHDAANPLNPSEI